MTTVLDISEDGSVRTELLLDATDLTLGTSGWSRVPICGIRRPSSGVGR